MFIGLLNRVKDDLVRTCLNCGVWSQLNSKKDQWGEPTKFLRVFDTKSRSGFSKRDRNGISCWTIVVSVYVVSLIGHVMTQRTAVLQQPRRRLSPFRGGRLP
jgi:hypothetical protein